MNMPDEFTVAQAVSRLNVSEETVRRNIRSKRLQALRRVLSGSFRAMSSWSLPTATTPRLVRCDKCYRCLALILMCPSPTSSLRQV